MSALTPERAARLASPEVRAALALYGEAALAELHADLSSENGKIAFDVAYLAGYVGSAVAQHVLDGAPLVPAEPTGDDDFAAPAWRRLRDAVEAASRRSLGLVAGLEDPDDAGERIVAADPHRYEDAEGWAAAGVLDERKRWLAGAALEKPARVPDTEPAPAPEEER